jgi:hypothetical protein
MRRTAGPRLFLVAAQSALAVVLAIGAALLLRSYGNLIGQDTGLDERALSVTVAYPRALTGGALQEALAATLDGLGRLPSVTRVAFASGTVVNGEIIHGGRAEVLVGNRRTDANLANVSPGLFEAAGMTMVAGRPLGIGDRDYRAIVVSESFAKQELSDREQIGAQLDLLGHASTVVGVVRDPFKEALDAPPGPTVFVTVPPERAAAVETFVLQTRSQAPALRVGVFRAVSAVTPDAVVVQVDTLGALLSHSVRDRTFATLIATFFGVAATGVVVVSLVGMVAFVVSRRTHEIAVRLALGARARHVRWLVIEDTVTAAAAGGCVGLLGGRWLSTWLESVTYGLDAGDWPTAIAATATLLTVMAAAALIPAGRALRLQPLEALRAE